MFGWMAAISRPSAIMPSASVVVAFTSPLIGPSTMDVISEITSLKSRPSLAIRDGLVVTPQMIPYIVCLADVFYISSINEKSHKQNPPQIAVFHTGLYIYYSAIQHNVKHNIAKMR